MEKRDNGYVSRVEEAGGIEETRGEEETRGGGGRGEGTKGWGSRKTMRGEKLGGGDAIVRVKKLRKRRRRESPHGR